MKKYILMTSIAVSLMSCNRSENDEAVTESVILPTKILVESQGNSINFHYNGNKLSEIVGVYDSSNTSKISFEYSNNLISKIVENSGSNPTTTTFEYSNGKLIKTEKTETEVESTGTPLSSIKTTTIYTYNSDGTITANKTRVTTNSQHGTSYTNNTSYTYTLTNGQVSKYTETHNYEYFEETITGTVYYDDKNGAFKNVVGFKEAALGLKDLIGDVFSATQNNYTSIVSLNNISKEATKTTYKNSYNSSGYPTQITTTYTYTGNNVYSYTYNIIYNK
ncbi:hypothetical protein PG279_07590 [Riemerella anatipestifer]|nr:hypothetical protein [Riemerella anatipestifer]